MSIIAANPCNNRAPTIWTLSTLDDFDRIKQPNDGDIAILVSPESTELWVFDADGDSDAGDNIAGGCQGAWIRGGPVVSVASFGAIGDWNPVTDTGTDNTEAVQAAADSAFALTGPGTGQESRRPTLYFPSASGYRVTGTIEVNENINVIMDGPIVIDALNVTGLQIGRVGQVNFITRHQIQLYRATQSTWLSESSIGVKFVNASTCEIVLQMASNNTIGAQFIGIAAGCAHNNVHLGLLFGNKYAIDLTNLSVGYCNQNRFFGGHVALLSGTGSGLSRYGVRITSQTVSPTVSELNNNNIFYGTSFELEAVDAGVADAIPVLMIWGDNNNFHDCRSEGNDDTFMLCQNSAQFNKATVLYGAPALVSNTGTYMNNAVYGQSAGMFNDQATLIWHSGPLHKRACFADGSTSINVPGVHIANSSNAATSAFLSGLTLNAAYLEVGATRGLGVLVDTTIAKKFLMRRDVVSTATGGWFAVRCYDALGVVITTAGLVKGSSAAGFSIDAGWGGVFIAGAPSDAQYNFEVTDAVKQIAVLILAPTPDVIRIRSFAIYSIEGKDAAVYPGYEEVVPGANIGTAAPSAGTWAVGRTVYNSVPTAGQPQGWACSAAPTTFRPLANFA